MKMIKKVPGAGKGRKKKNETTIIVKKKPILKPKLQSKVDEK